MRIAILTSGIRPVPAIHGGAVENLIDFYLEYNDLYQIHDITVYSIWNSNINRHSALKSKCNHYKFINNNSLVSKILKSYFKHNYPNDYYHYSVEVFFQQAFFLLRRKAYDVIIIENRPGFAIKLKKKTSIPLICHLHNDFLNSSSANSHEIFDSYNYIISVSEYITQRVRTINEKNSKCITVYNAIDIGTFHKACPINREVVGLNSNQFVVSYSGRLTEEKGILQLIKAVKTIIKNIPKIQLLIIGASTYGKDVTHIPFIEDLKKESEVIKEHVIFTGYVDYKMIPSYLKAADIAVVPSMWEEPFGLTVVEAMAAGLPLITTRSGGIPEICEGVATIVERENIVANLAAAILDLYQHPEKRAAMSKASLERSKLFDKETYAKNFFKAIEDGIGNEFK
ncbi:MAG: glycosyltransferase family 4 protein [Prevotella sp.]|nr:glycosyltransferase family 4 protein [Prevotella sp.]